MTTAEIVVCPKCGAKNRVAPESHEPGKSAACGRCKATLPTRDERVMPIVVTDATFVEQVARSPLPVLLDLWAPWCGPCRMVAPLVDELAAELSGRVRVAKMNVDQNPAIADHFRVSSIPTLLILKGGKEVDRIVGLAPKAQIVGRLERWVG